MVLQPDWDKLCAALEERLGGRGYELEFCQTRSGLKPTTEDPRWVRVLPKEGPRTIWIDLFGAFEGSKKQADSTAAAAANAVGRAGSAAKPPSSAAEATTRAAAAAADTAPGPASDGALPVTFKPAASATAFGDAQVGGAADRGEQDNVDDNDGNPHSGRWLMLSKSASTNIPRRLVLPLKRLPLFGDPRRQVPMPADVPGVLRFRYGPDYMKPAYVHKGRDAAEGRKKYARLMRLLGRLGLRI